MRGWIRQRLPLIMATPYDHVINNNNSTYRNFGNLLSQTGFL